MCSVIKVETILLKDEWVWGIEQLYNEVFFDLLAPDNPVGGRPALRLKEDSHGRVFVDGLSQVLF